MSVLLTAEAAQQIEEALDTAKNGLLWYRSEYPEAGSGADDEAQETVDEALAIIRAARAQEHGPVAEVVLHSHKVGFGRIEERKDIVFLADVEAGTKLYVAPTYAKDLTDIEILAVARGIGIVFDESDKEQQIDDIQVFARAVIAAYREKNKCHD